MTAIERNDLDRAIARAQAAGLQIGARGVRKSDQARVWGVTSRSRHNHALHAVVLIGNRLVCDCATRLPAICQHRALVHLDLAGELAALKAAEVAQARLQATRHDTAPMAYASADQPFSIYK